MKIFAGRMTLSYVLHDMRGVLLCPDVFVVTYSLERTSLDLEPESSRTSTSSAIWAKRGGSWLRVRYQETASQAAR
jgi:hypothetical protein